MNERTLTLCGGPLSPFARKAAICVIEKDLLSLTKLARTPTAMITPNLDLMVHNPLSKIPTLITADGSALFDSDVICEYLDVTYGTVKLIPSHGPERWRVLKTTALASGLLDALVLLRFERNLPPAQQSPEMMLALGVKITAGLSQMEATIAAFADDAFMLDQITTGCLLGYLDIRFADLDWRATCPNAAAWFPRFSTRPSAGMTLPYEYQPDVRNNPALQGRLYWE